MANDPASKQWHVTLCFPMFIKIGGELVAIRSFDATILSTGCEDAQVVAIGAICIFRTHKIWAARPGGGDFLIKLELAVFPHNVAGMVPQPFDKN